MGQDIATTTALDGEVDAAPSDADFLEAEAIVRPCIANGAAVFGVLPNHRFKSDGGHPMQMVAEIAYALMRARARQRPYSESVGAIKEVVRRARSESESMSAGLARRARTGGWD